MHINVPEQAPAESSLLIERVSEHPEDVEIHPAPGCCCSGGRQQ